MFLSAYQRIIKQNNFNFAFELKDVYDILKQIPCKVVFVNFSDFCGMVGFDAIYLDQTKIFVLKTKKEQMARIIGLLIHEGWHFLIRYLYDNFVITTPRGDNSIEGGYSIDKEIWGGSFDVIYWDIQFCDKVLEPSNWNTKKYLFNSNELALIPKRNVRNPCCSGLCIEYQSSAEM